MMIRHQANVDFVVGSQYGDDVRLVVFSIVILILLAACVLTIAKVF